MLSYTNNALRFCFFFGEYPNQVSCVDFEESTSYQPICNPECYVTNLSMLQGADEFKPLVSLKSLSNVCFALTNMF